MISNFSSHACGSQIVRKWVENATLFEHQVQK